jgi:hypothetical protein
MMTLLKLKPINQTWRRRKAAVAATVGAVTVGAAVAYLRCVLSQPAARGAIHQYLRIILNSDS